MTEPTGSSRPSLRHRAGAAIRAALSGHLPLVGLMVVGIAIGLLLVKDYGVSWDEPEEATMGSEALRAYAGAQDYFSLEATSIHGPAYFMLFVAASRSIQAAFPFWSLVDGRHLTNYLAFLLGLVFFYALCLRFVKRLPATLATALFATQPLFFGSSFIDQKDLPLMAFVLMVVTLGLMAGESSSSAHEDSDADVEAAGGGLRAFVSGLRLDWRRLGNKRRQRARIWTAFGLVLSVDLLLVGSIRRLGELLVTAAYNRRAPSPLQQMFDLVATDAFKTPLSVYLDRYETLFALLRFAALALMVGIAIVWLGRRLPTFGRALGSTAPGVRTVPLLASSIALGAAISMRQVGFFAGVLVSLHLLLRGRARAIMPLLIYWAIAGCVTYASWPFLWPDPIQRMIDSFLVVREFGLHQVLFQGEVVSASSLPWNYFPTLVGLQLTEPALLLAAVGAAVLLWRLIRKQASLPDAAILTVWVGVPVFWLISRQVPIYNNTRHLFFVFPPMLALTGVGLETAYEAIRPWWARAALAALALLPGILAIVRLHPYAYTYFNSLAGGTEAAHGVYDQEYYCVSLKEATEVVNQVAQGADHYMVFGPIHNVVPYARPDLILESQYSPLDNADIVAVCRFVRSSRWDPSGFNLAYQVRRGEAVFAEVWVRPRQ